MFGWFVGVLKFKAFTENRCFLKCNFVERELYYSLMFLPKVEWN